MNNIEDNVFTLASTIIVGTYSAELSQDEKYNFVNKTETLFTRITGKQLSFQKESNFIVGYLPLNNIMSNSDAANSGGLYSVLIGSNNKSRQDWHDDTIDYMTKSNGSWGIVSLDKRYGSVLGIDRRGIQPLYYYQDNAKLIFSSSLILFRRFNLGLNIEAVSAFLHFLYVPTPLTIYNKVKSILPEEVLLYENRQLKHYIKPKRAFEGITRDEDTSSDSYYHNFENLLCDSMGKAVTSGKKVALMLSGGKDSSALAIAANMRGMTDIECITFGFSPQAIDETSDAQYVAGYLGLPFVSIRVPDSHYISFWNNFIVALEQPMADPAAFPFYAGFDKYLCKYDIILGGSGNDIYFGNPPNRNETLSWYLQKRMPLAHYLLKTVSSFESPYISKIIRSLSLRPAEELFVSWKGWTYIEIRNMMGINALADRNDIYELFKRCSNPLLYKTLFLGEKWSPQTVFRKEVQFANLSGKCIRYPFVDNALSDFCGSLPPNYKYNGINNKVILRQFLKNNLPDRINQKKKGSFVFPRQFILASDNFNLVNNFLSREIIIKHGFVAPDYAIEYIKKYKRGDKLLEDRIWALLMLHSWAELVNND